MHESVMDLESVKGFAYMDTAFVTGSVRRYLDDMESYFRLSARDLEYSARHARRNLDKLDSKISALLNGHDSFWSYDDFGCPFEIDKTNYDQGREWCKGALDFTRNMQRAQLINQRMVMGVIEGGAPIERLDLANYSRRNMIVRIAFDPGFEGGGIRMRVFSNRPNDYGPPRSLSSESFASHASSLDGVSAAVITESGVDEKLVPVSAFVKSGKIMRSRLRVSRPTFETTDVGGGITYSIEIGDAHREMLDLCGDHSEKPEWLRYASRTWSPHQGNDIMRDLFGILAVSIGDGLVGDCYNWVFVPGENESSIGRAVRDGIFQKQISRENLPVLAAVYERTAELKSMYGSGFYPRFTIRESAQRSGMSMAKTKKHLMDLTGILAYSPDHNQFKWFLPKSTLGLAEEVLEKYYY